MERVTVWIDRKDGGREANVGTFERWLTDAEGRKIHGADGQPLKDPAYAEAVAKALDGYHRSSAADVLADLTTKHVSDDETGVLRQLLVYITKVGATILERQRRAENGTLRAQELAEIELENLTVFVRAE